MNDLTVGDLVLTRDQGFQPLIWVGRKTIRPEDLARWPQFAPVLIEKLALAQGLPERVMVVSPQHRMLIWGPRTLALCGEHEVLVPAIHLVGLPGITRQRAPEALNYVQLVFAQHQVIRCDGTWCESFQPSKAALAALDEGPRASLVVALKKVMPSSLLATARQVLRREDSRRLLAES